MSSITSPSAGWGRRQPCYDQDVVRIASLTVMLFTTACRRDVPSPPVFPIRVTHPGERLQVDDQFVYWAEIESATGTGDGRIVRATKTDGRRETLVSGAHDPVFVLDGAGLYWAERSLGTISWLPKAGGVSTELPNDHDRSNRIRGLVSDGGDVFAAAGKCIVRGRAAGRTSVLGCGPSYILAIAIDAQHVYWTMQRRDVHAPGVVMRIARTGGEPELVATDLDRVTDAEPTALALDDTMIYVTSASSYCDHHGHPNGAVWSVAKAGGPVVTLATGLADPSALVVDGTRLVIANTGCSNHPANDMDFLGGGPGFGGVIAIAKSGGTAATLVDREMLVVDVAIDRDAVYWLGLGWMLSDGQIGRIPR